MRHHLTIWLKLSILFALLTGCAGREFIVRGDELLKEGRYKEAIVYYEKARALVPDNSSVLYGIKQARILSVKEELEKADKLMKDIDYAGALGHALRASKMPLDLEEVDLKRRIRDAVSSAEKRAEDRVQDWINRGHYVPAVELAGMIVDASRGMASRKKWAAELKEEAKSFFEKRAAQSSGENLPGSSALQQSIAQTLGAQVNSDQLVTDWAAFAAPVCFGATEVHVEDASGKLGEMGTGINEAVAGKLKALQKRCGHGARTLKINVKMDSAEIVDTTNTETAAKPFPGVRIETEEIYYENVPYIVVEEVTEEETRVEKIERRDCAPRPGKPRGCVTWLEDVEKKVQVKVKKEVEKIKKVERRRPVKDLPADKVLSYQVTQTIRVVKLSGTISVEGAEAPVSFRVMKESRDVANAEVKHARMTIAADAMEAESLAAVQGSAASDVARAAARATGRAIRTWMRDVRKQAQQAAADGKMNQSEELYLQLVALGIPPDDGLKRFFKGRYGQDLGSIFGPLSVALGRELIVDREAQKRRKLRFPSKMPSAGKVIKKKPQSPKEETPSKPGEATAAPSGTAQAPDAVEPVVAEPINEVDSAFDSALGSDADDEPEEDYGTVDEILAEKDSKKDSKNGSEKEGEVKPSTKKAAPTPAETPAGDEKKSEDEQSEQSPEEGE